MPCLGAEWRVLHDNIDCSAEFIDIFMDELAFSHVNELVQVLLRCLKHMAVRVNKEYLSCAKQEAADAEESCSGGKGCYGVGLYILFVVGIA